MEKFKRFSSWQEVRERIINCYLGEELEKFLERSIFLGEIEEGEFFYFNGRDNIEIVIISSQRIDGEMDLFIFCFFDNEAVTAKSWRRDFCGFNEKTKIENIFFSFEEKKIKIFFNENRREEIWQYKNGILWPLSDDEEDVL